MSILDIPTNIVFNSSTNLLTLKNLISLSLEIKKSQSLENLKSRISLYFWSNALAPAWTAPPTAVPKAVPTPGTTEPTTVPIGVAALLATFRMPLPIVRIPRPIPLTNLRNPDTRAI
jgi:hypothetical protein